MSNEMKSESNTYIQKSHLYCTRNSSPLDDNKSIRSVWERKKKAEKSLSILGLCCVSVCTYECKHFSKHIGFSAHPRSGPFGACLKLDGYTHWHMIHGWEGDGVGNNLSWFRVEMCCNDWEALIR